ncbi:MAG: hypothetical protein EOS36_26285 [Mesorhizobium sp.]|uniref:hypothetical protein n=1 Tax=Mesorhizobium sp. TaxID=1871066 RepID=UPI000FE79EE6|nr:hypothetical protein [Mesorhizobium sp.]RWD58169.1 MAG: hypothetical protein EOS36_26285 [Mesorhizobium sp.]RWE50745.1 MAG: hypothetical protein EOS79_04670 [Mesorhizobium sp.]
MVEAPGKARRKVVGARAANAKTARAKAEPAPTPARPKRSRKTLGDDFAAALRADFRAHGAGVIAAVRAEKPDQYLKVVLTILPKEFSQGLDAHQNDFGQLSDEEIRNRIRGLEASLRPFLDADENLSGAARGAGPKAAP